MEPLQTAERGQTPKHTPWLRVLGAIVIVLIMALIALYHIAGPFGSQRLSVEELRDEVAKSIQSTWQGNSSTRDVRLKSLILVHRNGNDYTGVATADISGVEQQHTVEVTYDGKTFVWKLH